MEDDEATAPMEMEMEMKRISDDAWFHCRLSVRSVHGFQDTLNFDCDHGMDEDNMEGRSILTAEEAKCRIRPCSVQILSNGRCFYLQVGDIVAASRTPPNCCRRPLYLYDASIQKINKKQHRPQTYCKCTFELTWLDRIMKGKTFRASARQIYTISQESIERFPVLSRWLQSSNYTGHRIYCPYEARSESDEDTKLLEEDIDKIIAVTEETVNLITNSTTERILRTRENKTGAQKTPGDRNGDGTEEKQPADICLPSNDPKPRLGLLAARAAFAAMVAGTHVDDGIQDLGENSLLADQRFPGRLEALKRINTTSSCYHGLSGERDEYSWSGKATGNRLDRNFYMEENISPDVKSPLELSKSYVTGIPYFSTEIAKEIHGRDSMPHSKRLRTSVERMDRKVSSKLEKKRGRIMKCFPPGECKKESGNSRSLSCPISRKKEKKRNLKDRPQQNHTLKNGIVIREAEEDFMEIQLVVEIPVDGYT